MSSQRVKGSLTHGTWLGDRHVGRERAAGEGLYCAVNIGFSLSDIIQCVKVLIAGLVRAFVA